MGRRSRSSSVSTASAGDSSTNSEAETSSSTSTSSNSRRRGSEKTKKENVRPEESDIQNESGSKKEHVPKSGADEEAKPKKPLAGPLGRTGGVYIPPFKLAQMKSLMGGDKESSEEHQRRTWEALRKSINGLINKVNVANMKHIVPELFEENLVRGRGLFARAIMKAQLASPGFTHIYAALVAVVNTKLPENGELLLKRVIHGFKRAYKRRDKVVATALAKFIAHLVNHQVAHELLALQLLTVLLEDPTDDSVEIAVNFVKEVGQLLEELSPRGLHAIFERFRGILHEGDIDKRVQYTIEGLFAIRKGGFVDYPAVPKQLDLVERDDQITFELGLDDAVDKEEMLDVFRYDPSFEENEKLWDEIKKEILGGDTSDDESDEEDVASEEEYDKKDEGEEGQEGKIVDLTEQDLVNLRRTLYLTIMSALSFEECTHKIMKMKIPDGYESELCNMMIECCSNERSYLKYYGLIGQRLCMVHSKYQDAFDECFLTQYNTIHRLETNKLRNVAKFFSHLLASDALPWTCLEYIKLNEEDTTSSSRIFIKVLAQELSEALGLASLRERFSDPYMQEVFSGLFPRDNPRNTRFAINFFTSIGLGGLTDGLREHLKNAPKLLAQQLQAQQMLAEKRRAEEETSSSSDSDSSSSSSSSSSSGSSNSSSSCSSSSSSSSSNSSSSSSSSTASSLSRGRKTRSNSSKNYRHRVEERRRNASKYRSSSPSHNRGSRHEKRRRKGSSVKSDEIRQIEDRPRSRKRSKSPSKDRHIEMGKSRRSSSWDRKHERDYESRDRPHRDRSKEKNADRDETHKDGVYNGRDEKQERKRSRERSGRRGRDRSGSRRRSRSRSRDRRGRDNRRRDSHDRFNGRDRSMEASRKRTRSSSLERSPPSRRQRAH